MADKTCTVCSGPMLLGDRVVRSTDGLRVRHLECVPEGEPEAVDPEALVDKAAAWGKDTSEQPPYDPVPETCEEALALWDAGKPVFTVEMGGLGPSYEQVIHIVAMELVRYFTTIPELPPVEDTAGNRILLQQLGDLVRKVDKDLGIGGLSGAQADSAINLAFVTKRLGWRVAVRKVEDRMIQVMKFFPSPERKGR